MKKISKYILCVLVFHSAIITSNAQIFEDMSVLQCDSIILANEDNPNFVVLDVRRPTEYNPEHLMGAINRNYYDNDFELQLDSLEKHKTYVLHCKSGGRSGVTHDIMFELGFDEVYNMLGGMNAWKSNDLPITDTFASQIMLVSDSFFDFKEIALGDLDTILLTVTNRANALLIFEEICSLDHPEFSTDFDPLVTLEGAFDYSFNIFYEPADEAIDTLSFCVSSAEGSVETTIIRTGIDETTNVILSEVSDFTFYPNPAGEYIHFKLSNPNSFELVISDLQGSQVLRVLDPDQNRLNLSHLTEGQYLLTFIQSNKVTNHRLIKL